MSGERKGQRASARSTTSACIDGALSWDKPSLTSAQYGAGSSGFQNASIKAGIALEATPNCRPSADARISSRKRPALHPTRCDHGTRHHRMKLDSLLRHLRRHGCVLMRQGGRHAIWAESANRRAASRSLPYRDRQYPCRDRPPGPFRARSARLEADVNAHADTPGIRLKSRFP